MHAMPRWRQWDTRYEVYATCQAVRANEWHQPMLLIGSDNSVEASLND